MTRNRSTSRLGWEALLLLLALEGGGLAARAQPASQSEPVAAAQPSAAAPGSVAAPAPAAPPFNWTLVLGVLGGVALGVLGARLRARNSVAAGSAADALAPESAQAPDPVRKKRAENVPKIGRAHV